MKHTTFTLLFYLAFFSASLFAQNEYTNPILKDTTPDEDFLHINFYDFRDALVELGINIYKFDLDIPQEGNYWFEIYVQEYKKNKLLNERVIYDDSTRIWVFRNKYAEYGYHKHLRVITRMPEDPEDLFKMKLKIKGCQHTRTIKDSVALRPYFLRQFEKPKLEINKNIPLLLYSSGWKYGSGQQFCGPGMPPAKLDHEMFNKSIHYFIVGYRLTETESKD